MSQSDLSAEAFYKRLIDNLYDGVYFVDNHKQITYWNKAAEALTGYTADEVVGHMCSDNILMHVDETGESLCLNGCPLDHAIDVGQEREDEVFLHHKDGHRLPVSVRVTPIRNAKGQIIGAVEIFSDNTAKNELLGQVSSLEKQSLLDPLTRVGNRRNLERILHARFEEWTRYRTPFGVVFIDLDNFKRVNDQYGHDIGDRVLKMVGKTLSQNTRVFDAVGRWGGEEFMVVVVNVDQPTLINIAEKLRQLVAHSGIELEDGPLKVTFSGGTALIRDDDDVDILVKRADQRMYMSKTEGRNRITYSDDLTDAFAKAEAIE